MKLTFLGTGTSCGVPVIGCKCPICTSEDPRDKRTRCSALVETDTTRVMIDCGPDFRQQILPMPFRAINGILITHSHYDHVGGIDDLRPYCAFGDIEIYACQRSANNLHNAMPYCFAEIKYPGVPEIRLNTIEPHQRITIGDISVMPIEVMHGHLPILGFRFDTFAYITDMKTIADEEMPYLEGIDTLVVNALRFTKRHHSHQLVDEAIDFARRLSPRRTLFIHSCHDIGLHEEVNKTLPEGFELAYDGQEISL